MDYQYRVRDPLGRIQEGSVSAASQEEAAQQLRRDGFTVLELDEEASGLSLLAPRVSKNDIIYMTAQLAIMVETGINLSTALAGILEQEKNAALAKVISELKQAVEGGADFSAALARHPALFDKTYVSLVKASEATGTLGTMLDRIAGYLRKELEMRGKVRAAMAYPGVMMVMAIGVSIFLLTYIFPKFTPIFKSKGKELPTPTRIMMQISDLMTAHWYVWAALAAAAVAAFVWARRTDQGRRVLDTLKIYLPVVGPVFRKVAISRSVRTLGTMVGSGVPMLESIRLSGEVAGNYYYEKLWEEVREQVTTGKRICEVLAPSPLVPRVLVQMISSGEETGKLDFVLDRVSRYYDQEVETAVKTATGLIEPVMIAMMGFVVGSIGLALLLPIFSLSKQP